MVALKRVSPAIEAMKPEATEEEKAARAEGAAALCERGRVSFVPGLLGDLEEQLAGFDGSANKSDDAVDAFVHGCHELAGLGHDTVDASVGYKGISEASSHLTKMRPATSNLAALLSGAGDGGRI